MKLIGKELLFINNFDKSLIPVPMVAIKTLAVSMPDPPPIAIPPSNLEMSKQSITVWQLSNVGSGFTSLIIDSELKTDDNLWRFRLPFDVIICGFLIPSVTWKLLHFSSQLFVSITFTGL